MEDSIIIYDHETGVYHKSTPVDYIGVSDVAIVVFAIALRMLVAINRMAEKVELRGEFFDIKKYFDVKHIIRWALHISSAFFFLLVLPEFFEHYILVKYVDGLSDWTLLGSGFVGYVGYDLVKILEAITKKVYNSKLGKLG